MTSYPQNFAQPVLSSPQSQSSNTSSNFVPPSLASAIRPQLLIHKQEDRNVRSNSNPHLTLLVEPPLPQNAPRKGFDSKDFNSETHTNQTEPQHSNSVSSAFSSASILLQPVILSFHQRLYQIIDSVPLTLLIFLLMATDFTFFLISYLFTLHHHSSPLFAELYQIIDWLTAVIYLLEVNIRLYAYGPYFYFHGALRSLDYVVASSNTIFVIFYQLFTEQWVLATRLVRTLRMVTALTTWRERKLKCRTRQQLESLATLLEKEKSDRSKLTKWRIDPEAIAIGEHAGRGGFGTVFSGLFRGTLVAVKQVSYPDHNHAVTSIEEEAVTLVNLRHPNVVLFMGFVHEPSQLWIVTEYCSRGSLRDLLDDAKLTLTEGRILKLALGAARGLAYLHGQDPPVLHLDLKTSNVLISSGWDAKLGDFGLSRSIDKIEKDWFSGTMQYAAPEILESNVFSTAADIYSFGICLWEMAAREVPFQGLSPMAVLWGVVKSKLRPSLESINVAKPAGKVINMSSSDMIEPCLTSSYEATSGKHASGVSGAQSMQRDRVRHPTSILETSRGSKELNASSTEPSREHEKHQRHQENTDSMFCRMKGNEKAGVLLKEPVTASIVEGIVLPSTVTIAEKVTLQNTHTGLVEGQSNSMSHPGKKRSAIRDANRPPKKEYDPCLAGLTTKVTETIQMFDERPPIIRKKEEEGSNDYGNQSRTESVAGSLSGGQSNKTRRTILEKSPLRIPRQFSKHKTSSRYGNSSRKELITKSEENEDTFVRRLASISQCPKRRGSQGQADHPQPGDSNEMPDVNSNPKRLNGQDLRHTEGSLAVVPREYIELMQKCWSHNPKDRPSAGEIVWRLVILIDSQMQEK